MRVLALCIIVVGLCSAEEAQGIHAKYMGRHAEDMGKRPVPVIYEGIGLGTPITRPVSRPANPLAQVQPRSQVVINSNPSSVGEPKLDLAHSIRGVASWYCKAGVSICHHSYPPGSMVAAACGKLRRAMGPSWRGDRVTVSSGGRTVSVKLVDWCGSTTKLIDLYWEPMRRLGGSGTLPVVVRW